MRLRTQLLICAAIALIPALTVGGIALDHNPQGEFANTDTGGYTINLYVLVGIYWSLFAIPLMGLVTAIHFARRSDH